MSNKIRKLSIDSTTKRELFFLEVNDVSDIPEKFSLNADKLVCLTVWDSLSASVSEISKLADILLSNNCVNICSWGPDCQRVEDIIDETIVFNNIDNQNQEEQFVMTTSHEDESISEAIFYFLRTTISFEKLLEAVKSSSEFADPIPTALAIVIGNSNWATDVIIALKKPQKFVDSFDNE